ncbi:MAG: polysaccharide deacetylase family protein [Myxococcota bacterium]|nr:polysaccharide deacetylase family protein [Myxococcota bacterium]
MSEAPESLAVQLGFGAEAKVAVIHADDLGMCRAANAGCFAALDHGSMTCASIMVPCPAFAEAVEGIASRPGLDVGVHLTLNAEWEAYRWGPVAGASAVPSLVDGDGCFYRTQVEVLRNASADDVEREMRAQIDAVIAAGIDPTHLDAHMGTLLFPPFLAVFEALMRDYRLPSNLMTAAGLNLSDNPAANEMAVQMDAASARLQSEGFPILDAMEARSPVFEPGMGLVHNEDRVARLRAGVTYLIAHPAKADEELTSMAPDAACREFELEFYGGPASVEALARHGIETVGMAAIRDLLRN